MSGRRRIAEGWRNVPLIALLAALGFVLIGVGVILSYEKAYQAQKAAETQVQADVLGASVTAALDFGDKGAAQEAANALRANGQILAAGVYDGGGRLFAGYQRGGALLAAQIADNAKADSTLAVERPVSRAGTTIGTIRLVSAGDPFTRRAARYSVIAMLVALATLVVAVLGIANSAQLRSNARLAEANEALRLEIEERAKVEDALRQAQKMQALGQLTGGIAHDFNNLLTVIGGSADLLKRPDVPEDKRIRFASAIAQTAARAAALTTQLLAFARRQPLKPVVVDLNVHVLGMMDILERSLGARIDVRTELADDLCAVEVDPTQLEVAILNIAVNARDAMPDGGTITVRTESTPDNRLRLSVSDTGGGIAPEVLERVFEPFFTTKVVGKGTGLGLSQVYGFIAQSGGEARIDSVVGRGTTVAMILPCSDKRPAGETARPVAQLPVKSLRVLLVEDNEEVGTFAEVLLAELGHVVLRTRSAEEALPVIASGEPFDVVFSDIMMPGITGIELADRIAHARPGVPIILTSGYSDQLSSTGAGEWPVIAKPYRLETLAAALAAALR